MRPCRSQTIENILRLTFPEVNYPLGSGPNRLEPVSPWRASQVICHPTTASVTKVVAAITITVGREEVSGSMSLQSRGANPTTPGSPPAFQGPYLPKVTSANAQEASHAGKVATSHANFHQADFPMSCSRREVTAEVGIRSAKTNRTARRPLPKTTSKSPKTEAPATVKSNHHQNSARVARPLKSAYLRNPRAMASAAVIVGLGCRRATRDYFDLGPGRMEKPENWLGQLRGGHDACTGSSSELPASMEDPVPCSVSPSSCSGSSTASSEEFLFLHSV